MIESFLLWILTKIPESIAGEFIKKQLSKLFPKLYRNETKEIVDLYEKRVEEKNRQIAQLQEERDAGERHRRSEQERIARSLRRRSISVDKLIEQYHRPLNAIVISYATQLEPASKSRTKRSHFIREELAKFNSKYLGGTDALIPPRFVPAHITGQSHLEAWFEEEILKGRFCKVKFLILFDIRKNAFWKNYLPYTQKDPRHFNIGEVLSADDLFTDEQMRRIAITDLINGGDIAWLASSVLSETELDMVVRNQRTIEKKLNNPTLRVLASGSMREQLIEAMSGILEDPSSLADAIIDEAKFWYDKIGRN